MDKQKQINTKEKNHKNINAIKAKINQRNYQKEEEYELMNENNYIYYSNNLIKNYSNGSKEKSNQIYTSSGLPTPTNETKKIKVKTPYYPIYDSIGGYKSPLNNLPSENYRGNDDIKMLNLVKSLHTFKTGYSPDDVGKKNSIYGKIYCNNYKTDSSGYTNNISNNIIQNIKGNLINANIENNNNNLAIKSSNTTYNKIQYNKVGNIDVINFINNNKNKNKKNNYQFINSNPCGSIKRIKTNIPRCTIEVKSNQGKRNSMNQEIMNLDSTESFLNDERNNTNKLINSKFIRFYEKDENKSINQYSFYNQNFEIINNNENNESNQFIGSLKSKRYSSYNLLDDDINTNNIIVKRNESLKPKENYITNELKENIKSLKGIDTYNNINKKKKINDNNIIKNQKYNNNLVKGSPILIKNKVVKKIYLRPNDIRNNSLKYNNSINSNNNIIKNRIKSPDPQRIYQKPKNPHTNKRSFINKTTTPDHTPHTKTKVTPVTSDCTYKDNNIISQIVIKNSKIKETSSGTEDSYKLENRNDIDNNSNEYLSRLNYLKENLCYFTDKVNNKKSSIIYKYYNFYIEKQMKLKHCYYTKTYIPFRKLPHISNCYITKNHEIIYQYYNFKNNDKNYYYFTKKRKLVKPIIKMPTDDVCVFAKNIIYDRYKKKPKVNIPFNNNDKINDNDNIVLKPAKNKKRKKRRKTRRLHKMTEKEKDEKMKEMEKNEKMGNKTEDEDDEISVEEENLNITPNDNSHNIKSNTMNINISKFKSPIIRKSGNQSSLISDIEINLGDIEKNNQIKNQEVIFSYDEEGNRENEDFHIDSDDDEEIEDKSNNSKKKIEKKMVRIRKNSDENENQRVTEGKEINCDDSGISKYRKKNFFTSAGKNSNGYLQLRRVKLLKMLENIQKRREKIEKIYNCNNKNEKKKLALNNWSSIIPNINEKKKMQRFGEAINKIEGIFGKKIYISDNEEDVEENVEENIEVNVEENIEKDVEENVEENKNENKNENNLNSSDIKKYQKIFELNPIKKLEIIMNKQVYNNISITNIENNNTTTELKNNTTTENNNNTNSDNNFNNSNNTNQLFSENINNINSENNINSLDNKKKYTYEEILLINEKKICSDINLLPIEVLKYCTQILKEIKNYLPKTPKNNNNTKGFTRSIKRFNSSDISSMEKWARKDMTKEINLAEKYKKDLNKNLSKDIFKHKIIEILNTLTVDNYNDILKKIIEMIFLNDKENKTQLLKPEYLLHNQCIFVEIILDKATIEKGYVILYAKLCADLYTELLRLINDYVNHEIKNQLIKGENLKTILIGECQQRFDECNINNNDNNIDFFSMKKKFLGNMNFIAELINVKIISQTLGFKFLDTLYKRYKEIDINSKIKYLNLEGAVILLGKFGKIITDRQNAKHIQNLDNFINDKIIPILTNDENNLPNYLKYKIINLIEKKKNNWKDSLYEKSINAKGKYCNFIVNSDEDNEENGDKIIIDESFDENGFNKEHGIIGNEDEENTKENNIIILLKEDIENYISFLNENNIYNKKDLDNYFSQNDNYDINNEYNWTVVNELIIKLKIELEEIIRCYIEVCIDYVTKENIIFYVNEYIKNIINYYGLDLSDNDLNRFHNSMVKLFLNAEDVCVDNGYMWEIMGFLLSVLIWGKYYKVGDLDEFGEKDKETLGQISNVVKFAVVYYDGDKNEFVNKIKDVEIYKKNQDLFEENILNPLKNKYGMDFNI